MVGTASAFSPDTLGMSLEGSRSGGSRLSSKNRERGLECRQRSFPAVDEPGHLKSQDGFANIEVLSLQDAHGLYFIYGKKRIEFQETLHITVIRIYPVLVEIERTGFLGAEPYGAGSGFPHLGARGGGKERKSKSMGALAELSAYKFYSGDDISPLVVAAHLQAAVAFLRQIIEIICLEQHIIKLDEIEAGFQADLVAFGGEHPVYAEVPADITQELNVAKIDKPVGIVEQQRLIIAEIQKT